MANGCRSVAGIMALAFCKTMAPARMACMTCLEPGDAAGDADIDPAGELAGERQGGTLWLAADACSDVWPKCPTWPATCGLSGLGSSVSRAAEET